MEVLAGTAMGLLQATYGMTETGARRVLADAARNGSAETAAVRLTCISLYPEQFEITDLGR